MCATPPTALCQFVLKLNICFGHCLKMCICLDIPCNMCAQLHLPFNADYFETSQVLLSWDQFLYNSQLNFCHFFQHGNLDIECYQSLYIGGTLCTQLLLQFYTYFLTICRRLYSSWPEDMNMLRIKCSGKLFLFSFCT